MKKKPSKIGVLILAWNQIDEVIVCLDSFSCIDYPDYDIILVDNGSEDGTAKYVKKKYPHVHVIETGENLGFCRGNNRGIEYCLEKKYEYVFLLNSDTKVLPGLFQELMKIMMSDPKIGIIGAKNILMEDPSTMWGQYGKVTWGPILVKTVGRREPDKNLMAPPKDVDWVIGNGCLIRGEVLQEVGGFDENFWQCNEDADLSFRIRRAGYRVVYADTAAILHKGGSSADSSRQKRFNYGYFIGRNAFTFAKKHANIFQMIKLCTMVFIGITFRLLVSFAAFLVKTLMMLKEVFMVQKYFIRGVIDGIRGTQTPAVFILSKGEPAKLTEIVQRKNFVMNIVRRFLNWLGL